MATESRGNQEIKKIDSLDAYIVVYTDGAGKDETRIVFKPKARDVVYVLNKTIGGTNIATSASDWFTTKFLKTVCEQKPVESV
jgi:hypothetical protein